MFSKVPVFLVFLSFVAMEETPNRSSVSTDSELLLTNIPENTCPEYFQYIKEGNINYGRITAFNSTMDETAIEFEGAWPAPVDWITYGRISLQFDRHATMEDIRKGNGSYYRVDFPNPFFLPKLTRLTINGIEVCVSANYSAPTSVFRMKYAWQPAGSIMTRLAPNGERMVDVFTYDRHSSTLYFTFPLIISAAQKPRPPPNLAAECGRPSENYVQFIHFGSSFKQTQFPWLVAIYVKTALGIVFTCSGSLISSQSVVTAAHCIAERNITAAQVLVYLGRYNLQNYSETSLTARDTTDIVVHPDYRRETLADADIAILHLSLPVEFSQHIRPICLTEPQNHGALTNEKAYVAGWGADGAGSPVSPLPKIVDTNIASHRDCASVYKVASTRTICAGNLDKSGPCMGDSGSGLMRYAKGRWTLVGVVSGGMANREECDLNQYVLFCNVAEHIWWVRENLQN